jgi:molybdopterin biosynthesis enzyme
MQGASDPVMKTESGILAKPVKASADRDSYIPAQLTTNDDGQLVVFPLKWGGSSDFVAFARATALAIIPAGAKMDSDSLVKLVRLP